MIFSNNEMYYPSFFGLGIWKQYYHVVETYNLLWSFSQDVCLCTVISNNVIISTNRIKSNKFQQLFMMNTLRQLRMEGTLFNLMIGIYPKTSIIFLTFFFSKSKNKWKVALPTLVQHFTKTSSQCSEARKLNTAMTGNEEKWSLFTCEIIMHIDWKSQRI